MQTWLVSKVRTCWGDSNCLLVVQNTSKWYPLSASGHVCRITTKLLLLLYLASLLILLVLATRHSSRQQSLQAGQPKGPGSVFTVPPKPKPTPKPKARSVRPLKPGLPCRELPSRFPDSIPPIVHFTTKDGRVHKKLIGIVQSWLRLQNHEARNSSVRWYYLHWDDIQISRLIDKHYPLLSKTYKQLSNGLERSDIGRLFVLHHVGGVYVDSDVDLTPLLTPQVDESDDNESKNSSNCRTALWSQEPPEHADFIFKRQWLISNALMMSRANHSFLSYLIYSWPAWFEQNWAKRSRKHETAVMSTGPMMLQSFYDKYMSVKKTERPDDWCDNIVAETDMFQPIMDEKFVTNSMRRQCSNIENLPEPRQTYCRHALCANFQNRQVPNTSYTAHHFMHLSYTNNMKLDDSQCEHCRC